MTNKPAEAPAPDVAEQLRELSRWLLTHDIDMKMPAGMIDPEVGADEITCLTAEVERLRSALERGGDAVVRLAFLMPPPNDWTPQFVALGQAIASAALKEPPHED